MAKIQIELFHLTVSTVAPVLLRRWRPWSWKIKRKWRWKSPVGVALDRAAVSTGVSTERCVFFGFYFYFFNSTKCSIRTGFAKTCEVWKNILWWYRCELSTGPAGFALLPSLYLSPSPLPAIFSPSPSLSCLCLCVSQRSPLCGVHFQSPFRTGNPPGDAVSLSQLILFSGLFNTIKCLVKSSQIRRMTTSFVIYTASWAYLCVVLLYWRSQAIRM